MKKVTKHVGVLVLAIAMVLSSLAITPNATTVSAKTVKAKTLKMKKKVVKLKVGQKKKLSITVKPKKATIKWKSSKKKVATVSKKGVVTAKKVGTTKITATSGKKKAVCTVKVSKATVKPGIASITVLDPKTIRVNLTAAKALSAGNFVVHKKSDASGAYLRALGVASVNKINAKCYEICLKTEDNDSYDDVNCVYDGDYVQVKVAALTGNKVGQTQYTAARYARARYFTGVVGNEVDRSVGFSQSYTGYLSNVKISGVPNGLTAKVVGNYVVLKGTLKTAKASVMTLTAKDEKGKNLTQKYSCYVGSDSVMFSYIEAGGRTILANDNWYKHYEINTVGGSGTYSYSLPTNKNSYIAVSTSGSISIASYKYDSSFTKLTYFPAGKYNVAYQVRDSKGHINNGTLAFTAVNGVKVSGRVLAADGSGLEDASVQASFVDPTDQYYRHYSQVTSYGNGDTDQFGTAKMKAGDYTMMVYPSQRYTFYAQKNGAKQTIGGKYVVKSSISVNFKLPIYRVSLSYGTDKLSNVTWYDADGSSLGRGTVLYLTKGNYAIHGSSDVYTYKAAFGVSGNRAVKLNRSYSSAVQGTITVDSSQSCGSDKYLLFTAPETATYTFKASGCGGNSAAVGVYDSANPEQFIVIGTNASEDTEQGVTEYLDEFTTDVSLTAGKLYLIRYHHDNDTSATISVSKKTVQEVQ